MLVSWWRSLLSLRLLGLLLLWDSNDAGDLGVVAGSLGSDNWRSHSSSLLAHCSDDSIVEALGLLMGASLESEFMLSRQMLILERVFSRDSKLRSRSRGQSTDRAVGEVERELRLGIVDELVVVGEFVEVFRGRDDVVVGRILSKELALALEGAGGEGSGRAVGLVGEGDGLDGTVGGRGVGENVGVALGEAGPFVLGGNLLSDT